MKKLVQGGGGYPDFNGSTTNKTHFFMCVFPNLVYKKCLRAQKVRLHTKLFAELTQCTNLESINILTGNFSINIIIFRLLTVFIHFTFILGSKNNHSQNCQISVLSFCIFRLFKTFPYLVLPFLNLREIIILTP